MSFIKDPGYKARAGLGLEPSAFRWHYESRICHINKVFNLNRMHGECYLGIFVASPFKFLQASDSTNEVNPLISAKILDAKNRIQNEIIQELDIQTLNRVILGN